MIPKDTIDKIFEASRIEEVVGDFVSLRKRGVNMLGLCPFHKEKTPSFTVSPAKNIFKCFGCGKGGSSVDFIMEHEQMTYPEALRYLAKKYGIAIEEQERTADDIAQMNERESLFHVVNFANEFFQQQLHETEEGKAIGLSYLKERGLRIDIIRKFQIGYSPEAWDLLTEKALENGYKEEFLEKTGLTIFREGKRYDRFRARIIFPIFSVANRTIAFGGRILDSTKSAAKYVNSPESDIYHKSAVLYGLNWARAEISRQNVCYLCEGYMDVVALHQAGIENVVASSGTSLTTEQIRLIKRYTPNITILYDGDPAGIKASFRGIDMILEEGMNVRVLLFPEGEDPDSFARTRTAEEVSQYIKENAVDFITFKTNLLLAETDNDPLKKADLVREIIATIALIPENITREAYIKQCATIMNMEESVLIHSLNQARRNIYKQKKKKQEGTSSDEQETDTIDVLTPANPAERQVIEIETDSLEIRERDVIRLLVLYGDKSFSFSLPDENGEKQPFDTTVAEFIINDLQFDGITFERELYQIIYEYFLSCQEQERSSDQRDLIQHENPEIRQLVADMISSNYTLSDGWEKRRIYTKTEEMQLHFACTHALLALKGFYVAKQLSEAEAILKLIPVDNAEEQIIQLKEILKLTEIKQDIASKLTRTRMPD
ncbi:MAG: DNA primase [Bacteroidales bacterium]|nr:DNA primase [Bacteroidales bacterium]